MNTVHRVLRDDLFYSVQNQLPRSFVGRVENNTACGLDADGRILSVRIVRTQTGRRLARGHAVGIDPCVQAQTALLTACTHDLQRVIAGRFALLACQNVRGRVELGRVERVAERTHLHDERIEAKGQAVVCDRLKLLAKSRFALVRFVLHAQFHIGDPHAAHVVRRGRRCDRLRRRCRRLHRLLRLVPACAECADRQHRCQQRDGYQYGNGLVFSQIYHLRRVLCNRYFFFSFI